jgi:hypothetical protein
MAMAVLHTMKIRSSGDAARLAGHNDRSHRPSNSDPSRPVREMVPQPAGPWSAIESRVEQLPRAKVRANSVKAVSMLLSASPEYFGQNWKPGDEKTQAWLEATQSWLDREFGDLVVGAWAHYDEKTPHLHVHIVPGTNDGRLSAKERFGRTNLRRYQTQYAKALEPLGIKRGLSGSRQRHVPPQVYRNDTVKLKPIKRMEPPPLMLKEQTRQQWMDELLAVIARREKALEQQAQGRQVAERQRRWAEETAREKEQELEAARRERAQLRDIDLKQVLEASGWQRDPDDRNQYIHSAGKAAGRISVQPPKWYDHAAGRGAGGAIDLAMHVHGFTKPQEAVGWLRDEFGAGGAAAAYRARQVAAADRVVERAPTYKPPEPLENTHALRSWLTSTRRLASNLAERLIESGGVYASRAGKWINAVFPFIAGKGAEVKGIDGDFKGNAPGSSPRQDGWIWRTGDAPERFIVAESPLDALAYHQIHHADGSDSVLASTAGAKPYAPSWLRSERDLMYPDLPVIVAYDNDDTGARMAPSIAENLAGQPHLPPKEDTDWSDMLPPTSSSDPDDDDEIDPMEPSQPRRDNGPRLG